MPLSERQVYYGQVIEQSGNEITGASNLSLKLNKKWFDNERSLEILLFFNVFDTGSVEIKINNIVIRKYNSAGGVSGIVGGILNLVLSGDQIILLKSRNGLFNGNMFLIDSAPLYISINDWNNVYLDITPFKTDLLAKRFTINGQITKIYGTNFSSTLKLFNNKSGTTVAQFGSSITASAPSDTLPGDLLLAFTIERSAAATTSNFTIVKQQVIAGSTFQTVTLWQKIYALNDPLSYTFTQANSSRHMAVIIRVRKSDNTLASIFSVSGSLNTVNPIPVNLVPTSTNRQYIAANTSENSGSYTVTPQWEQFTPTGGSNNRLCVGAKGGLTTITPGLNIFTHGGSAVDDSGQIIAIIQ